MKVFTTPKAQEQDLLALRETDLFPATLPAVDSEWVQPRTAQLDLVTDCIGHLGIAEQRMIKTRDASKDSDYQSVLRLGLGCIGLYEHKRDPLAITAASCPKLEKLLRF